MPFGVWNGYDQLGTDKIKELLGQEVAQYAGDKYCNIGLNADGQFSAFSAYDNRLRENLSAQEVLAALKEMCKDII